MNALRSYSLTANLPGGSHIISDLIRGAEEGHKVLLSDQGNADEVVDRIGVTLNDYWRLKKCMAAGSEPPRITRILNAIRPLSVGLGLAGAGGGGFIIVILRSDVQLSSLTDALKSLEDIDNSEELSVHYVTIEQKGISTKILSNNNDRTIESYVDTTYKMKVDF